MADPTHNITKREPEEDELVQPKTAKDLFSDFKPSSDEINDDVLDDVIDDEYEEEDDIVDQSDSDDEPLAKRSNKKSLGGGVGSKKRKRGIVKEENEGSGTNQGSTGKKKKIYVQKYKKEWETIPSVRPWISESVHGSQYFYCRFCKKDYKCGKTEIFKHMSAMKHKRHIQPSSQSNQQKLLFRGLLCPVITPFTKTRKKDINYKLIGPYAKFLKACGVKGILLNDVTGEGMSLTVEERKQLVEFWGDICREKNQFLMVQVGGAPLKNVIEMAIHAEKLKVGAIVLMPDMYNPPKNHLDVIRYIKCVAEYTEKVPIMYHHYPRHTRLEVDMSSFLLDITGEVETFCGVIFSTNDLQDGLTALTFNPEKFVVFMGTDDVMLGAVASGFRSLLCNSANILPKLAESIIQCCSGGEIKSAQQSQQMLKKAMDAIYSQGDAVAGLKAAISIMTNLPVEPVREPLQTLWEGTVQKMKAKFQEIGII